MDYTQLESLISELEQTVEDTDPQRGYWRELWALVRQIGTEFRDTRYPTREDRDRAYSRFQDLVAKARARSEENQARIEARRSEWERQQDHSRAARDEVQSKAASAHPLSPFERTVADIVLLPIEVVAQILLRLVGIEGPSELEEIRQELLACNEKLRESWRLFNSKKQDLLPGDKHQAYESLQAARQQLDEAWRQWKDAKSSLRERRQREWEQRQRAREVRQAEREEKHQHFVARVEANIAKLEEKLAKATSALERQETHLEELREKLNSAWSDGFRDRCSEWISECESRIESIEEHIERLEGWIEEERAKLN